MMRSKRIIGITLVVALALSATIFMLSLENTNENDTVRESGVIERVPAADRMITIIRNDSECLDTIGGGFVYAGGIFNQTGESTAYIYASGGQTYSVLIDTPNGTVESIEKVDRFPEWVYQTYKNIEVTSHTPDNEKAISIISEFLERTGHSINELFVAESPALAEEG